MAEEIKVNILGGKRVVKEGRRMMSRRREDGIHLLKSLTPGLHSTGCCVCCSAPACCPMCSALICCDHSKYIVAQRDASKYVLVRENSLEWNEPEIVWEGGNCFGIDPCLYGVQDNPQVVYYDDPMIDEISDQTRWCNETRTCLNGGSGERVQLTSTCFFGICYRASFPCPCVPVCVPTALFPCARRRVLYLKDAAEGIHEIKNAVRNAREHDPLYQDQTEDWHRIVAAGAGEDVDADADADSDPENTSAVEIASD